ncbi:MAG: hypothetical protein PHO27_00830 [Sulfuricurvum sp.]|nr:hypothetical protein [Sulfuricurvum sp.]
MRKTIWLLRLVGTIQVVLGGMYLFAPAFFLASIGHSVPQQDIYYPLSMLASRFLGYGAALLYISNEPIRYRLWIQVMILIQLIDLLAGIYYTATDVVSLSISAFPMFNAGWIILFLSIWMPKKELA